MQCASLASVMHGGGQPAALSAKALRRETVSGVTAKNCGRFVEDHDGFGALNL
jgi:hypothetical protein